LWEDAGKKIEVQYQDLSTPLSLAGFVAEIHPLLPERHSPLNRNGTGNQGHLFALPPRAGRMLLGRIGVDQSSAVEETIPLATVDATERRALALSRIGQGRYRESLMEIWDGWCGVTDLDLPLLLRASHIKPWRDSDNRERLDPYNGLLLSPSFDAVFDVGLITFADDGRAVLSAELTPSQIVELGIDSAARITRLQERHRSYLDHHRVHVFSR
jgi:hypothetical protein